MTGQAGASENRRLLVVSCEFDAHRSPQGMRWVRLAPSLAALGWQVDVLTFSRADLRGLPASLSIHRVFPGPYQALLASRRPRSGAGAGPPATVAGPGVFPRLNWKGRADAWIRRAASCAMYPDYRREGLPWLRRELKRLLARHHYVAAVLSHEPALALELQPLLQRAAIPVVADLGDPVEAAYTPRRWRRRARALEAGTCSTAAAVVVTSDRTRALLRARHALPDRRLHVITQGYAPAKGSHAAWATSASDPLRVVYTGRVYGFRNPARALEAVAVTDGVELDLAIPDPPPWLAATVRGPGIRMLGHLSQEAAVDLQRRGDVLLLVGNADATQVPGKLFEYLGSGRPILYVAHDADDEGAALVKALRRGWVVGDDADLIADALARLRELKRGGALASAFDLDEARVAPYAWDALAARYSEILANIAAPFVPSPRTLP